MIQLLLCAEFSRQQDIKPVESPKDLTKKLSNNTYKFARVSEQVHSHKKQTKHSNNNKPNVVCIVVKKEKVFRLHFKAGRKKIMSLKSSVSDFQVDRVTVQHRNVNI